jgi:sirohydrochlorin ferrochelatase
MAPSGKATDAPRGQPVQRAQAAGTARLARCGCGSKLGRKGACVEQVGIDQACDIRQARPAPVALIVAHGQPSDPEPAAAEIAALARRVALHLPDWSVRSATLASETALQASLRDIGDAALLVYPLFMADGWFTQTHLPARLVAAGAGAFRQLAPFGLAPEVQALTVALAREALGASGQRAQETDLLLAAHGSFRSPAPSTVAWAMAARIAADIPFRRVATAFIDQEPQIATVARDMGPGALCLPFFAARGGHVTDDLPEALAVAAFQGQLLAPVGLDARVPGLIARALAAGLR